MQRTIHQARWPLAPAILVLLLAFTLRLAPWGDNRFLEDEALYGYWGLQIATGADPMLDAEPVDKPPVHPYVLALSSLLFAPPSAKGGTEGPRESAARLPSLLASTVGVALIYALGQVLSGDSKVGLLAALLLALSPFDASFASTAFTDPLMTAWVLGALLAAARGRLGAAGILAGLAAATKQQGLYFLPLVLAVGVLRVAQSYPASSPQPGRTGRWRSGWLWFGLGFVLVAAGVMIWDLARVQRPGFVEQGLISYGGLGPAQPEDLGQRAAAWLRLVGSFWVSPWFNGLLAFALLAWLAGGLLRFWPGPSKVDLALAGFLLCLLLLHWLVGFQVWDRYLLELVPLSALLAARALATLGRAIRPRTLKRAYAMGLGLALVVMLAGPALQATRSELPLGGDHGAYDGIDLLASYLRTEAPPGSVLYHHWLGYHYRFYLYGASLRQHWYPDLVDLVHDATIYRREPRYIAFPSWQDGRPAELALADADMDLVPVFESTRRDGTTSFRLYHLEGP
jgi:4-amino-4-deoxy-L-arabinose transferase-like glycosyltransferase